VLSGNRLAFREYKGFRFRVSGFGCQDRTPFELNLKVSAINRQVCKERQPICTIQCQFHLFIAPKYFNLLIAAIPFSEFVSRELVEGRILPRRSSKSEDGSNFRLQYYCHLSSDFRPPSFACHGVARRAMTGPLFSVLCVPRHSSESEAGSSVR